ncbi:MAG: hypothetical protein QXW06_04385, partial [Thermoplasmata archaeon]
LPVFKHLFKTDRAFACEFIRRLRLEEEHVALLLDAESTSPAVRNLLMLASGEGSVPRRVAEFGTPSEEERSARSARRAGKEGGGEGGAEEGEEETARGGKRGASDQKTLLDY